MIDPAEFYTSNLSRLHNEKKILSKRKSIFGITRLGTLIAVIIVFYFFAQLGWMYVTVLTILLLILFRWLILKDLANKEAITRLENLIQINTDEQKALQGEYYHFADGKAYQPHDHQYANDIDVIGHASLYQYCNRTTSGPGGRKLADWLLNAADLDTINQRQDAVKELSLKRTWGQDLQAAGIEEHITEATVDRLAEWLRAPVSFIQFTHWKWLRIVLPLIICTITVAAIFDFIPMNIFYISLLVFAVIAYQLNTLIAPLHNQLSKMAGELETLSKSISIIEHEKFAAPLLNTMRTSFDRNSSKASKDINQVKKILERLDLRYNIVLAAPLNLLFLWNLQQVLDLEKWKLANKEVVAGWFNELAAFEALNSFATIYFNNPDWAMPEMVPAHFTIQADELGHPLISKSKRVDNYISIQSNNELMIVTGSNMAGKSTYLRSVGVNVILAMAGAPVCARSFILSPVQLWSSMRVADNLEESTSTFYAELKKLKLIIDKVNNQEKVFILLDEILRGTNSLDRHTGSVALVKQLIRHNASAIIATHDVSLAEMKKDYEANILNFHFDAQVSNDELYFDYKLKPGISTSLNASILMKKIGIEL